MADDCHQQGLAFIPMVAEALEGLHEVAVNVRKLGNALSLHTGELRGERTSQTYRTVSMLLQRGNAQMLRDRFASHPPPEIDGIY